MFGRVLYCLVGFIGLFGFGSAQAQQKRFEGRWYLGFHDMVKVESGSGCVLNIGRLGDGEYMLSYLKDACTGSVPPEGKYTVVENTLTKGDWALEANHISITYTHGNVYTEFRPVVVDSFVGTLIATAANDIDSAMVRKPPKVALLRRSIATMNKALQIDSRCVVCMVNESIAWLNLQQTDSAAHYYLLGRITEPNNTNLPGLKEALRDRLLQIAWDKYGKKGLYQQAIDCYKKNFDIDPLYPETYYNIGGAYYTLGNYKEAKNYFEKTLQLKPDHEQARQGLDAATDALSTK